MNSLLPSLAGIHHVTAITSSAEKIYDFFTYILGLRLVKKTVNQDDVRAYHLFFADDRGNPGTDMTFFDFGLSQKAIRGTNEICRTGFRVKDHASLRYWKKRFEYKQVKHEDIKTLFGRQTLNFEDFDGQLYALFSDEGVAGVTAGEPWHLGPVPDEFAIVGLGPIFIRVNDVTLMEKQLVQVMGMRLTQSEGSFKLFEMGQGGNGASVIIDFQRMMGQAIQGYGTVHHVAFRIQDRQELDEWRVHLLAEHIPNSGFVDRFYFQSLYARVYPRILFEFATEGPGFIDDEEPYETLGEALAIPPHLRNRRELIERMIRPFNTKRSHKVFKKEYEPLT
jgi:glyoxalase family protein